MNMPSKDSINKLSQKNVLSLYQYLYEYTKEYAGNYGKFHWEDNSITDFCKKNNIVKKGTCDKNYNSSFFWFETFTPKGENTNDKAYHFLRHIRNSIAHANIRKERKKRDSYFIIDDYNKNGKQTMHGRIKEDLFFAFVNIIINTLK